MANKKRGLFSQFSSHQEKFILAVFVPGLTLHFCLFGLVSFLHYQLAKILPDTPSPIVIATFIDQWSFHVIIISITFILLMLFIAFLISKNLVGAFDRIIRELDEVLEGKRNGPLTARKRDDLVNDLLKRINRLIEERK